MSEGQRSRLSLTQRTEIWSRWRSGQSLHEIGRAFGKPHSSIRCLLLPCGGIPPAARRHSGLTLTLAEREDISRGIASGSSICKIARHLDRAASTVSREVTRHGGRPAYRAYEADDQAWESALHPRLREVVASKLILDWWPEQISGWLRTHYPADESMRVSYETVYRRLFNQARGVLKKELMDHLRRMRRSRYATVGRSPDGKSSTIWKLAGKGASKKLGRLVTGSLSVVSEARVSKLHTRARCVCALSIQRLEGRRWRLRRMRVKGPDLTAMGIQSSRSSVSCWFCGT